MAESVLLLGHGKETCRALAGVVASMGYRPVVDTWRGFSPRAFGRRERPSLILADVDKPAARPMADFSREIRRLWGEAYPIIAVSAASKFQDVSALLDAGASDCLPKAAASGLMERKIGRCLREAAPPKADELSEEVPGSLLGMFVGNAGLVRLGDLVDVHSGATPRRPTYRRMAPPDHDWRGVLTSDVVDRFSVGKPSSYLSWNRLHLFRLPPPEEYAVPEKVLLRRAGPPLAAAVDRSRLPAGTDVYSLTPREGVGAGYVACLLNSRLLDFYFNRIARLGTNGRLRPEDIRETPVPAPDPGVNQEMARAATLLAHYGPNPQSWVDKQSREETLERMENTVFKLYGANQDAREGLAALHF